MRLISVLASLLLGLAANAQAGEWRHGISYFGDLLYPADFTHFDYVNPDAPKVGELRLAQLGNFDTFNPYIRKGRKAVNFAYHAMLMTYDRLMYPSDDEPAAHYGWLAEAVMLADDYSEVRFRLREGARWHDGHPLTTDDVLFTFEQIKAHGSPTLALEFSQVTRAEIIDSREIVFYMEGATSPKVAQAIAIMPISARHYYESRDFSKTTLEPPLGSGPYRVVDVDPGRRITFELVDDYWGRDIPVNRGRYNIRHVSYDYFSDINVIIEAIKAGDLDANLETQAKRWDTQYEFPGLQEGHFIKDLLTTERPVGMALGILFNLRLEKFQPDKVREALSLVYDFEWLNRVLMYDFYNRTNSYFSNSDLASQGPPSPAELEILERYRGQVPERLFSEPFEVSKTDGYGYARDNVRRAARLLSDAGYGLDADGRRLEPGGKPFTIDFITSSASLERTLQPYLMNLDRLGIKASVRLMEISQFIHRMGAFDYEATIRSWPQSPIPGPELRNYFGSEAAGTQFSRNEFGIRNPVVDDLIELVLESRSYPELITRAHALDRVLLWNFYVVPGFYAPGYRYGYWNKYTYPETQAEFRTGFFDTWWYDVETAARVNDFLSREATE
ncbi:MAG: extracellular solute-binding protein [Pseudomonadota bacterium]